MTRVLLVAECEDDYQRVRHVTSGRYAVEWVRTAGEGLTDMRSGGHDVYIVDAALVADGALDLPRRSAPVILLTSDGDPATGGGLDYIERARLDGALVERVLRYALERAAAARALRDGEDRLLEVLDSSSDLVHSVAPDGRLIYVNRTWRDALGYTDTEISGLTITDIVVAEHRQAFGHVVARALDGERVTGIDTVFAAKDGRRLVVSGYMTRRVDNGRPVAIYGGFRDVTEQRRAEDAQRRLVATLEATTDLVAMFTMNGRTVYLNRAGRRLLGISDGAIVRELPIERLHPPEARRAMWEVALPAAIRDGTWQGETTVRGADGGDIPASQVIVAHRSAQGGVWFLSTIIRDITEWKKLDQLKSEFVSTVSHELRTPLTSMRGALGLLESGVAGALSDKGLELVNVARANCERLIRLINDILDLDKIEAGRLELTRVVLPLGEVVRETLDGIAGMAAVYGIRLDQRVDETRPVLADRDRIVQVLTNLVSNAIKFSPTGACVRVTVRPREAGTVRVAVENPGAGIAAADCDKLFRRFQQLDGADNRQHGGTGLGLSIAKAIVDQHGGRIGFDSEPDVTTTFWFDLPVTDARA